MICEESASRRGTQPPCLQIYTCEKKRTRAACLSVLHSHLVWDRGGYVKRLEGSGRQASAESQPLPKREYELQRPDSRCPTLQDPMDATHPQLLVTEAFRCRKHLANKSRFRCLAPAPGPTLVLFCCAGSRPSVRAFPLPSLTQGGTVSGACKVA